MKAFPLPPAADLGRGHDYCTDHYQTLGGRGKSALDGARATPRQSREIATDTAQRARRSVAVDVEETLTLRPGDEPISRAAYRIT